MRGKTRWEASNSLRQQVLKAAGEANAEKAFGLLAARYSITEQTIRENPFSKEVAKYLESGMARADEIKHLRVTGKRTVTIEMLTEHRTTPKLSGLLAAGSGALLNSAMLWFNIVSLKAAYMNFQDSGAEEHATGMKASILGVIGGVTATMVSVRAAQKAITLKLIPSAPGMQFGNGLMKVLDSRLLIRATVYPAIFLGLMSDYQKAERQEQKGNKSAASFTRWGSLAIATGSFMIMEGGLLLKGWPSLVVILLGGAILAAGVYLNFRAQSQIHTPIELWAARSLFGNGKNDGESRPWVYLNSEGKLPRYPDAHEEISAWHNEFYSPLLLSDEQTEELGLPHLTSNWHTHISPPPRHRTSAARRQSKTTTPSVEFTVLLRNFEIGRSRWTATLMAQSADGKMSHPLTPAPLCFITPAGLALNFKHNIARTENVKLSIQYIPNLETDETLDATSNFTLGAQ